MSTITESSKKFVFNKEADEQLTESELEAWNAFEAWEASIEEKEETASTETLADKIDFENPVFIKALSVQLIIEEIKENAWEKLNEQIQHLQSSIPEETTTKTKPLFRLHVWKWVAAAVVVLFVATGIIHWYRTKPKQPKMVTITTGYGETRPYTLPDGTHGLLNALSSITYPEKFTGNERNIELTGEAWFEVQSDKKHPFKVHALGTMVTATGTEFNVKAYEEEERVIASLKKGTIEVKYGRESVVLKDSGQATVFGLHITTKDSVDFNDVLAWAHNEILLEKGNTRSIMRQVHRYYQVNYLIEGNPPPINFHGRIKRENRIDDVITFLNTISGETRFYLHNDTVFVYKGKK